MKKITEIILDKKAPLNLKSLWAEPQDDSTVALKVFNNGKWRSTSIKVDLSAYQTKTDESLQTVDKTIAGAINELNSNIGESGYNLIEYGVTTYDELVEMAGNGKPCILKFKYYTCISLILYEEGMGVIILNSPFQAIEDNGEVGVFFINPIVVLESNKEWTEVVVSSMGIRNGLPSYDTEKYNNYSLSIPALTKYVEDSTNILFSSELLQKVPEGEFAYWVAEIAKTSGTFRYNESAASLEYGTEGLYIIENKEGNVWKFYSRTVDGLRYPCLRRESFTIYGKAAANGIIFSVADEWTNNQGYIPTIPLVERYLTKNYQPKITPGTGLAFDGNTLNVTLDTNVFFVAESAPASPTDDQKKKICLVPADTTEEGNLYTEYVWVVDDEHPDGYWKEFGTYKSEVDLTPYLKIEDAAAIYQPKGNYQPAGDYATNTALTEGLAGKQPTGDYALKSELPSYTTVPELTADYTVPANATTREFIYEIPVGATVYNITGASGIKWAGGTAPAVQANKTYLIRVIHNLATYTEF